MLKTHICSILASAILLNSAYVPFASASPLPVEDQANCTTLLNADASVVRLATATTPEAAATATVNSIPRKIWNALRIFPVPYLPFKDVINDTNKRFRVFVENPPIGVLSTAVGVSVARFLMPTHNTWIANFIDSFLSFTVKDTIANGLSLQESLSGRQKYWLSYLYTILIYSITTMSTSKVWPSVMAFFSNPAGASPSQLDGAAYALGLLSMGIVWPLLSQVVNTLIMPPLLFNRFLQAQDLALANIEKTPNSTEVYKSFEDKLATLSAKPDSKSKREARYLRFRYMWVKWRRDGLKPKDLNPFTGRTVQSNFKPLSAKKYWFLKASVIVSVATTMIVAYFTTRNWVIGTSPDDLHGFSLYIQSHLDHLQDRELNDAANAILSQTPKEILDSNL